MELYSKVYVAKETAYMKWQVAFSSEKSHSFAKFIFSNETVLTLILYHTLG